MKHCFFLEVGKKEEVILDYCIRTVWSKPTLYRSADDHIFPLCDI